MGTTCGTTSPTPTCSTTSTTPSPTTTPRRPPRPSSPCLATTTCPTLPTSLPLCTALACTAAASPTTATTSSSSAPTTTRARATELEASPRSILAELCQGLECRVEAAAAAPLPLLNRIEARAA